MKITAFKDPVTGLLFEDEAEFVKFKANRAREEAAAKKRQAVRAAADRVRKTMVNRLARTDQFPELARAMYEHLLNNAKTKRKKAPLTVVDIRTSNWEVSESLSVSVDVEVELSGSPAATYADVFFAASPSEVLHPFSLRGCGSCRSTRNGTHTYVYSLSTDLKNLPKLLANMVATAHLQVAAERHQEQVDAAASNAQSADAALAELTRESAEARRAYEAAMAAYQAAMSAQQSRAAEITAAVATQMPFELQEQLQMLERSTSLGDMTDQWRRLSVRRALTRQAAAA